jgi:uncharacterized membrane protein
MKVIMGNEPETKSALTGDKKVSLAITIGIIGFLLAKHHAFLTPHAFKITMAVIAFLVVALLLKAIPERAAKQGSNSLEEIAEQDNKVMPKISNGRIAYDNYREGLVRRAKKHNSFVNMATFIFLLAAIAIYVLNLSMIMLIACVVLAVMSRSFSISSNRWLSSAEYYSFPGARLQNMQHRCIFCGGKGIYIKGLYASNNRYAYCTKCESPLFVK